MAITRTPPAPQAPRERVDVLVIDELFVAAEPAVLAPLVADPARWAVWWPDLTLHVTRDRGAKGQQWQVGDPHAAGGGSDVIGSAEIWLEPWRDGTILHLYLRLRARPDRRGRVRPDARERQLAWKRCAVAVKDAVEAGRRPGTPALTAASTPPGGASAPPGGA